MLRWNDFWSFVNLVSQTVIANLFLMGNNFNEMRWKKYQSQQSSSIYSPSHQWNQVPESWRNRDLSPTWNLEIKS